ncbi:MAG TPA: glycosyltransferase family 4 protein [Vicinamibacterales bacterium]|nr:glycosyltransferase family 4 protein [Vicinamibacterales bacterium]
MRVLHLHSGNLYGGVETFLATLARCRDLAPSMEMTVALSFDGLIGAELRGAGVATPLLGEVRLRRPASVWRARRALAALLSGGAFDVAVCHQAWPLAIFGPVVKASRTPLVSWLHMAGTGRHWLDRLASRVHPDCIVCNSRFTAASLPPVDARVESVYAPVTLRPVVATDSRASLRGTLDTNPDDVVIIQVSRMEPWKGQRTCLEALAQLRDRAGWACWQVGGAQRPFEARYLESLKADAARLGIADRVHFLGQRSDVTDLLRAADIFCQPNLEPEPFGISLVEALAAGLPVVTSNIGGAVEIVDDTCGVLVPPRDPPALASTLDRLVCNAGDRSRLADGGPARARALCDPATQMRRIADLLHEVSGHRQPAIPVRLHSTRLRLAVFSYGLPAPGQKRGGIERAAHTLAQGLAERGHHVVVFSHDLKPEGAAYEVRNLPWSSFVNTWLGRRVTMGYLGNVMALLPDYKDFDAIIAHGDSLLLPLAGKPVLRVMHGSALGEAAHATSIGRCLLQCGIFAQELLTALTGSGTVGVSENTRRDNPFVKHVIPHGVDTRLFRPMPSEKTAEPSLMFVGAVEGRKRGAFLLDVFQQTVRPALPDATLMFVGPSGPEMPGVTYRSGVDDAELATLYRRAWLYVSPSTYEGFGLPYLEAMACGTAVLATPNPGSDEVLAGGQFGKLVNDAAFGAATLNLLGDETARRAMEVRGLRRAQELSLDSMLDRYETLLAALCDAHVGSIASA